MLGTLLLRKPGAPEAPADDDPEVAAARARLAGAEAELARARADDEAATAEARAAEAEAEARGDRRVSYVASRPVGGPSHDPDEAARLKVLHRDATAARHEAEGRRRSALDRRERAARAAEQARADLDAAILGSRARADREREARILPLPEAAIALRDALDELARFEAAWRPAREAAVRGVLEARASAQRLYGSGAGSPAERAAAARAERDASARAAAIPETIPTRLVDAIARSRHELARSLHAAGMKACRVGDMVVVDRTTVEPAGRFEVFDATTGRCRTRTTDPITTYAVEVFAGLVDLANPAPDPVPEPEALP